MDTLLLFCLVFTGLNSLPLAAHLLELPNKMRFSKEEYLVAQKLYRGWAISGLIELPAVILVCSLAVVSTWDRFYTFAAICLIIAHGLFWIFVFPANKQTRNWNKVGEQWKMLRRRWEYAHAARALLFLLCFVLLLW